MYVSLDIVAHVRAATLLELLMKFFTCVVSGSAHTEFMNLIQKAANEIVESGKGFGSKAFIGDVYAQVYKGLDKPYVSLEIFKEMCVGFNRKGDIALSRADLVSAMDPQKVKMSEVVYMNATFHFVDTDILPW